MSKALLKSTAIVGIMTLVSRISGLVRDVVMASVLGSSGLADAFFVAFRIPNFLRRIFAEGAFSQAFVPVFSELTEQNTAEAKRFVNATATNLAFATLFITVLGFVFADSLVRFIAPGYVDNPAMFAATVDGLRIMFPYLFCVSMVAMSAGVLNTLNRFAVPAATPIMLNVCMITALLLLVPYVENALKALAYGVLAAGFIQIFMQVPSLLREGFFPNKFSVDVGNPHLRKVTRLMLPAVFSVSVAQINLFVNTILATSIAVGSVSWLNYSDRLMSFPVGVFGVALATVVLPSLSRENKSGTPESYSSMMDWALRWVIVIAVPASFALYLLATPLLSTILQRGEFNASDVVQTSLALQAFAAGVSAFILIKVLAPGFFARQDTKTPVKIAIVAVAVNVVLSLMLVRTLQHTGLALATSLAAWVNAMLLFLLLIRQGIYRPESGWLWFLLRVAVAVGCMSAVLTFLNSADEVWHTWSLFNKLVQLSVLVVAGGLSYFSVLFVLGVRPHQLLLRR